MFDVPWLSEVPVIPSLLNIVLLIWAIIDSRNTKYPTGWISIVQVALAVFTLTVLVGIRTPNASNGMLTALLWVSALSLLYSGYLTGVALWATGNLKGLYNIFAVQAVAALSVVIVLL